MTLPLLAVAGTVALIFVAEAILKLATLPSILTLFTLVKFFPSIMSAASGFRLGGENPEIVGA